MLNYMRSSNVRTLKARSSNVSIGVGLIPNSGGNLADCAAHKYDANFRDIGSRLKGNGAGDAESRLGWEANNASSAYPVDAAVPTCCVCGPFGYSCLPLL